MGNSNKKKLKENKSNKDSTNNTKKNQDLSTCIVQIEKYKPTKLAFNLIKKLDASDTIEEVIVYPDLKDSIIIACRKGEIKEVSNITSSSKESADIITLYSFSKRIYSLIMLKKNSKNLCVGLDDEIVILNLKLNEKHILSTVNNLICKEEGSINSLLELENGNIISAGKNIILWKKDSSSQYIQVNSISAGLTRIINIIEFPLYNTIIATQEETHIIFLLKNNKDSIELIKKKENIPSIWYKGSAQNLSKNAMILIGKFEMDVIDPTNGEINAKYPGIDRGTLLNFSENYHENDLWIVTNYMGRYLEFYKQEGNDLLYFEKYEFDESEIIGWGNRMVKINNEYFASINHYGNIFVFKVKILE